MIKNRILLFVFVCGLFAASAQTRIDGVVAVVGDKILLHSAVENQLIQFLDQNRAADENVAQCQILEEQMFQKLLSHQAEIDSVEITESEINSAVDQRIAYFVSQIGSEKKVEVYFGKSIKDLKADYRPLFREQLLAQRMQSTIVSNLKTTPEDVRDFFNSVPADSLPLLPSEIQLSQIVLFPKVGSSERKRIETKLLEFKERVANGEDFGFLASLYSEDLGSAQEGGELGYVKKGKLVPEFEKVAFRLQKGEVSNPVKTKYGFHLIQMTDRKGEQFEIRHILIKPNASATALENVKSKLDSISLLISLDSLTFEEAAFQFSQDDSKNNGGIIINQQTGSSVFLVDELETSLSLAVNNLSVNDISKSSYFIAPDQRKGCRIVRLDKLSEEHHANLQDDYDRIQNVALQTMKADAMDKWRKETIAKTYIKINQDYDCNWVNNWKKQ